jgi:group I intron endonuclease
MSCGIYKITSPTNRVYIGQGVNIEKRWKTYKVLDCKTQRRLYNSLVKYGVEKHIFEIIELCELEVLNVNERKWQEYYNSTGRQGLNCLLTKTGDKSGKLCEATKKKMSEYWLSAYANGRIHPFTGRKLSEEHKEALREARKYQVITKESREKAVETRRERGNLQPTDAQRQKMSDAHIGKNMPEETKQKIKDTLKGRTFSDEWKQKISDARKLNPTEYSEETRKRMSLAKLGKIRGKYKKNK